MTERNEPNDSEAKKYLKELSETHPKLFEKHFREWMEKDGVARSLQAKLRCDLIANFNTTQLGKQLISQNCTSSFNGGNLKRLALSPLILALNTLVGEFLYAQNCHFSLSVFCAEVPYRNALPDFECSTSFRFTKVEIAQIMDAISGSSKCEDLKNLIIRCYEENSDVSLLFSILKIFIDQLNRLLRMKSQWKNINLNANKRKSIHSMCSNCTSVHQSQLSASADDISNASDLAAYLNEKCEQNEIRRQELTTYRLLNKYLMVLTKRVKEMVMQCEKMYQNSYRTPAPEHMTKIFKPESVSISHQVATEALDNVTKELKKINVSEYSDKDLFVLANAIQELSRHFDICGMKFEDFRRGHTKKRVYVNAATETEPEPKPKEKSYSEWIKEMRTSKNGKKFLDKIAVSIQKALEKQKAQLKVEADVKLQHQAELLKIHYKQKYIDQLKRNMPQDKGAQAASMSENIEKQLQKYEERYQNLLTKLAEIENQSKEKFSVSALVTEPETEQHQKVKKPIPNIALIDTNNRDNVKKIISDVQQRLQELDAEGTMVESKLQEYLARQQTQTSLEKEATQRIVQTYVNESHKIMERYEKLKSIGDKYRREILEEEEESSPDAALQLCEEAKTNTLPTSPKTILKSSCFNFTNAIAEAKKSLNLNEVTFKAPPFLEEKISDSMDGPEQQSNNLSHSRLSDEFPLNKKSSLHKAKCEDIEKITKKALEEKINTTNILYNGEEIVINASGNSCKGKDTSSPKRINKRNTCDRFSQDEISHNSGNSSHMGDGSPNGEHSHASSNSKQKKQEMSTNMDQLLSLCTQQIEQTVSSSKDSSPMSKKALLQKSLEKMEKLFSPSQNKSDVQNSIEEMLDRQRSANHLKEQLLAEHTQHSLKQDKENLYKAKNLSNTISSSSIDDSLTHKIKDACSKNATKSKIKALSPESKLFKKLQQTVTNNVQAFCSRDSSCSSTSNISMDTDSSQFLSVHLSTLGATIHEDQGSSSSNIWKITNNNAIKK